jgi:hypothetical protein
MSALTGSKLGAVVEGTPQGKTTFSKYSRQGSDEPAFPSEPASLTLCPAPPAPFTVVLPVPTSLPPHATNASTQRITMKKLIRV